MKIKQKKKKKTQKQNKKEKKKNPKPSGPSVAGPMDMCCQINGHSFLPWGSQEPTLAQRILSPHAPSPGQSSSELALSADVLLGHFWLTSPAACSISHLKSPQCIKLHMSKWKPVLLNHSERGPSVCVPTGMSQE